MLNFLTTEIIAFVLGWLWLAFTAIRGKADLHVIIRSVAFLFASSVLSADLLCVVLEHYGTCKGFL